MKLSDLCQAADKVIVDGYTYEWVYDEIRPNHDRSSYRFKGDAGEVLPDQELRVSERDPDIFIALNEDGVECEVTGIRVRETYINEANIKEQA